MSPEQQSPPPSTRIPNFKRFLITGAVIGFVVGVLFAMREPGGPSYNTTASYDPSAAMGYLGALGAFLGAGVAGIVALLLDKSGRQQ